MLYKDSELANEELQTSSNNAYIALAAYIYSDKAVMPNSGYKRKAANIGMGAIISKLQLQRKEQATQLETLLTAINTLAAAVSERLALQRCARCY